ncbi:MAG TPA: alpha-2-macroglobulin family protein, partial [Chitinophagaceae bacterium]
MNFKPTAFFSIGLFLTLFYSISSFGQAPSKTYDSSWKELDALMQKQLPKSALEKVKLIYQQAKKEKHDGQMIKALVYEFSLQDRTTEDNGEKSIVGMEKEITTVVEPVKSILNSLLAGMYWDYYQAHRYQLYQRTNTEGFKKEDIATWTTDDFHKKISELYLQSIKNSSLLQQTNLDGFDAIIMKGNMRHLRPTLFDLLAHEALDYLKNNERDITKPAYSFEINEDAAFAPATDFIQHKFETSDSLSLQYKALLIYQQLISFHLHDAKPDALIDLDLERLQFVDENTVQENKDQSYLNALEHIAHQYDNLPAASQAWYLIAANYDESASNYQPLGDSTHRFDRLKAKDICEKILAQIDSSEGKTNCYNLLNTMNEKELTFDIETVNIPNQPFRALVQYRNFSNLYLRLIKADDKLKTETNNYYAPDFWKKLSKERALRSWEQLLPDTRDMQKHATEVKIDGVAPGSYFLLLSVDKNFSVDSSVMGARRFYVSDISYINNGPNYFILDRETGHPLAGATAQVWESKYDYKTSDYVKVKSAIYTTDDKGYFKLAGKTIESEPSGIFLDINFNGDRLFMDNNNDKYYVPYDEYRNQNILEKRKSFLFTDRSIYRPGQAIFFKGIVLTSDLRQKKNTVQTGYQTVVYLRNVNQQLVDSIKVTTNEYGSFSGKFQLPQSGLNGEYTIVTKDNTGYSSISVEEYKRPQFYVDFEKLKGSYRLSEKIKVTGIAKAYAGNNIDEASVKYRIVRQPRIIYDWFWFWQPPTREMEIAHGETKTGKDGKFLIEFNAIPDLTIDRKFDPVFDYRIYADVADINGETRSGSALVTIGYQSLILNINVPSKSAADSFKTIAISTTNMSGEFEAAKVRINIYRLKEEQRLIRERYWGRPDQFTMSRKDYIKWFPTDEYDNEHDYKSWERQGLVFAVEDSTRENSNFEFRNAKLTSGFYSIEITTRDKDGQEIKDVKYIELYDQNSSQLTHPQYFWTNKSKPIEPGEKTSIGIGSSAEDIFVIQRLDKSTQRSKSGDFSTFSLNNEKKMIQFTATEDDRGGYGVSYAFVKNNRTYVYNDVIQVPWTNKDLKIEYETFRDKLLPGSEEKWKVKITGTKNEPIVAEMLASMYDASLDQFKPHDWYKPSIWPYFSDMSDWNRDYDFDEIEAEQNKAGEPDQKEIKKFYDFLVTNIEFYEYQKEGMMINKSDDDGRDGTFLKKDITGSVSQLKYATPLLKATRISAESDKNADMRLNVSFNDLQIEHQTDTIKVVKSESQKNNGSIQIRKNFNETAFFFPDLHTDSTGTTEFSFTMPEAVTKWKLQTLAHTKDLAFGLSSKEIVTQKQLMVQPNMPRFLREGDKMELSVKIVNLTDSEFTGQAQLQLIDATTNQPVDGWFLNMFPNQYFTVAAGQSEAVKFPIQVPYLFNKALAWRIVAKAGEFSDGEEDAMPVLTNKTLVTETLPLNMRGNGTKNFKFEKLLNSENSETLQNHALIVEYTSNPAWYAVQSLPYLIEYPYECAEQTWNRYYANSLASMIANSSPRIKAIFEQWKTKDTSALLSNLQKNEELKSALLEETPWVLEAKSEEEQKKNIGLLFDLIMMSNKLDNALSKLEQMQSEKGGFVWFKGGPDDQYITQYILTGIGHLRKLKAIANGQDEKLKKIITLAIPYLDKKIREDYEYLIKYKTDLKKYSPGYTQIQYLYMRSFFPEYPVAKASQIAYNFFRKQSQLFWANQGKYMQGMIALALSRTGDTKTPSDILESLKETAINNDELGMYWKNEDEGWFWYQAPVETQSLLIEAFAEIKHDTKTVDDLKTWLLKNKQTSNWETTKATAEACYALLLQGSQWLTDQPSVTVKLGSLSVSNNNAEAGTGYFKKTIEG